MAASHHNIPSPPPPAFNASTGFMPTRRRKMMMHMTFFWGPQRRGSLLRLARPRQPGHVRPLAALRLRSRRPRRAAFPLQLLQARRERRRGGVSADWSLHAALRAVVFGDARRHVV
ncbi:unnamed protein product [Prunus armeniaca]|uniref:Uncharacterized protein n=1 Tax=Prunus armeniaca TaxID=36596 RepID=A0A6J5WY89_PRUAR|nr:unnamed protein product [Prunus armeniaca]